MPESTWAFEFEEPSYITIGMCYEEKLAILRRRLPPILKRCEEFSDTAIAKSLDDARGAQGQGARARRGRCRGRGKLKAAGLMSATSSRS